jgi:hypothetical protein
MNNIHNEKIIEFLDIKIKEIEFHIDELKSLYPRFGHKVKKDNDAFFRIGITPNQHQQFTTPFFELWQTIHMHAYLKIQQTERIQFKEFLNVSK